MMQIKDRPRISIANENIIIHEGGRKLAEVKWIKITTSMFEDEKVDFIESLPESDAILIIWIKLLTLAGKNNSNGFIFLTEQIPYTEEMLAHRFRRPLSVVKLALKTFESLGMIEFDDIGYLKITNWEKHQNIEGLEKIREQNRIRKQRQREREKALMAPLKEEMGATQCHVTVTGHHATELEEELEEDIDIEDTTKEPSVPYEKIKTLYNETCKSLSNIRSVSTTRKKHLKARWEQFNYDLDSFKEVFELVEGSRFLTGTNNRGWKADFDWLIKNDNNMLKVLEGKYNNEDDNNGPNKSDDQYDLEKHGIGISL